MPSPGICVQKLSHQERHCQLVHQVFLISTVASSGDVVKRYLIINDVEKPVAVDRNKYRLSCPTNGIRVPWLRDRRDDHKAKRRGARMRGSGINGRIAGPRYGRLQIR